MSEEESLPGDSSYRNGW